MPTPALESELPPQGTPNSPLVTEPSAPVPPSLAPSIDLNNPAVQALVETARKQEKDKLYADKKALQDKIVELKDQLDKKLSPDEKTQVALAELQKQLTETMAKLEATQTEANEKARYFEAETRRLHLQSYLDRRLREEQVKGTEMRMELIGGTTEQEIEQSITLATSEYAKQKAEFFAKFQAQQPPASAPAAATLPVSVQAVPITPAAFPTAPNAAAVPTVDAGTAAFAATVAEATTPEAVRSGAYGKVREKLLADLRATGVTPPAGASFTQPRHIATVQVGDVTVPHGNPTGPVAHPQAVQAPPQPASAPTPAAAPAPAPAPAAPAEGPAAFRAAAVDAMNRALQNPAHAARAGVVGARPAAHGEYGGRAAGAPVVYDGTNPMIRNS